MPNQSTGKIQVALLDEASTFGDRLVETLDREGINVIARTPDPDAFQQVLADHPPDVALLGLPSGDAALGVLRQTRRKFPGVLVLVASPGGDPAVVEKSREEGAAGYVDGFSVGAMGVARAIKAVAAGAPWYSPGEPSPPAGALRSLVSKISGREYEVLRFVASGADNLKIAAHLEISERTVKAHVQALYRKLGSENRTRLALLAIAAGVQPREEV